MALITRVCTGKHSLNGLFNRLCKVSKFNNVQVAHITGRINRMDRPPRPPPFPYREKEFSYFKRFFDYGIGRFDDNSVIIVVDGPIAAGKDKFARELAKELEMGYMPPVTFDRICKDGYGNDVRDVDHTLPERIQICDIERFLTNPKHASVPAFEMTCYMLKAEAYVESLIHLLSTGEGVVINRSLFSNYVFMEAMYNAGYINQRCRDYYYKVVSVITSVVMKPHLVIYLDVPVNVVQERIKKRCIPYEVNSKVLTKKFLTDIETKYKEEFLPAITDSSYVLMYDWANGGDIDEIVEDIEHINLVYKMQYPYKLSDWKMAGLHHFSNRRVLFSRENRQIIFTDAEVPDYDVTEMFLFGEDAKMRQELFDSHHVKYEKGYNTDKGDKVLWKLKYEGDFMFPNVITNKELLASE